MRVKPVLMTGKAKMMHHREEKEKETKRKCEGGGDGEQGRECSTEDQNR